MKTRGLVLALALALFTLTACGGDDERSGSPTIYEHTDEDLGHSFEVLNVIRDLEIDTEEHPDLWRYDALVMVEFNVQAGDIYRNGMSTHGRLRLFAGDVEVRRSNEMLVEAGEALGFEMLSESLSAGATETGHILYGLPADAGDDLTLRYTRSELKEWMGGDKTIPALEFDVPLAGIGD